MGKEFRELVEGLPVSERTLRRWLNDGLLHSRRLGSRKLTLSAGERRYVRRHGRLLSELRRRLRTERNVRLAVLFGSTALGQDVSGSDIDLLVSLRDEGVLEKARIAARLERAVGRQVQLVSLADTEQSPSLLADVLEEGRVLLDRDSVWPELTARRARIVRSARREEAALARRAREAVGYLRKQP